MHLTNIIILKIFLFFINLKVFSKFLKCIYNFVPGKKIRSIILYHIIFLQLLLHLQSILPHFYREERSTVQKKTLQNILQSASKSLHRDPQKKVPNKTLSKRIYYNSQNRFKMRKLSKLKAKRLC
jgi:hypothetical protein